jgi:hypothetical protein
MAYRRTQGLPLTYKQYRGPAAPLPVTPAGEAAGGGGKGRRQGAWSFREPRGRGEGGEPHTKRSGYMR